MFVLRKPPGVESSECVAQWQVHVLFGPCLVTSHESG